MNSKNRTSTWLTIAALCLISLTTQAQEKATDSYKGDKKDLHVYLLIGQSNMAGRAPISEKESGAIPNCYLLNQEAKWEPASNPLNRYSTIRKGLGMQKLNPGYNFSKQMLSKNKDISIGLVVNAKGGTRIEQWAKGTKFYQEAIRRAKEAQQAGTLKGILWHQGESNHGNPDGYLDKLKELIENLRKDLDSPKLPFVAGQVHKVDKINEQIAQLPKTVPHTSYVSSKELKTMDRWHFDAKSMLLLGKGYAVEMQKLQAAAENKQ